MRTSDTPADGTPQGRPSDDVQVPRPPAALNDGLGWPNGRVLLASMVASVGHHRSFLSLNSRSLSFFFRFAFAGTDWTRIETFQGEERAVCVCREAAPQTAASVGGFVDLCQHLYWSAQVFFCVIFVCRRET